MTTFETIMLVLVFLNLILATVYSWRVNSIIDALKEEIKRLKAEGKK